jgi:hypothetical protein
MRLKNQEAGLPENKTKVKVTFISNKSKVNDTVQWIVSI